MRYNVPLLNQSVSPICYVVAAAMIQKYWQQTAGSDFDTTLLTGGASPLNSCIPGASTNAAAEMGLEEAGFLLLSKPGSTLRNTNINKLLMDNGPLLLVHLVANFNYGPKWGGKKPANAPGAHAVVITGLEGNRAYVNNPWGDKDMMVPVRDLLASITQAYNAGYRALGYAISSTPALNMIY